MEIKFILDKPSGPLPFASMFQQKKNSNEKNKN